MTSTQLDNRIELGIEAWVVFVLSLRFVTTTGPEVLGTQAIRSGV